MAVAAADVLDEYCSEVAKEQATSVAEERVEYLEFGYSFQCMCCGFDGKTYQCEECTGHYCSKECQKMDFTRHKVECEKNKTLKNIPNYPEINYLIETIKAFIHKLRQQPLNLEVKSNLYQLAELANCNND